jgi:hypothetical protein
LKLDEGVSLAMLVSFAQDMFPGVSTEDIGVWPADDGELVVSVQRGLRRSRPCAAGRDFGGAVAEAFDCGRLAKKLLTLPHQESNRRPCARPRQGVALARTTLAAWDLLHGRLVIPIDISLPLENTYWIVYPKLASREPRSSRYAIGSWRRLPRRSAA